jgi:hypothetical protein
MVASRDTFGSALPAIAEKRTIVTLHVFMTYAYRVS